MVANKDRIVGKPKITVVGVGGGGSNAVTRMFRDRIPGVEYIAVNTDAQALARSQANRRLRVGDTTARGLGVGGDPERGRKCHEEDREAIEEILAGSDLVFIAAGMGGGTGTGGAPVIASVAQKIGALTVGVVTKPFPFEGSNRQMQATEGIKRLSEHVDTVIVIPNGKLLSTGSDPTLAEAFKMADNVLKQGVQAIAEIILVPGEVNLDFADVKSVMKSAGQAWMAIGYGAGPDRAIAAAKSALDSPLLEVSVEGAKGVIFNVTGGPEIALDEVTTTADFIRDIVSPDANVYFGLAIDEKMEEEVKLTVIATGFPLSGGTDDMVKFNSKNLSGLMDDKSQLETPPYLRNKM